MLEGLLAPLISAIPNALVVPFGEAACQGALYLARQGLIDENCVLRGFPHPSGANGHRKRILAENKADLTRQLRSWFVSRPQITEVLHCRPELPRRVVRSWKPLSKPRAPKSERGREYLAHPPLAAIDSASAPRRSLGASSAAPRCSPISPRASAGNFVAVSSPTRIPKFTHSATRGHRPSRSGTLWRAMISVVRTSVACIPVTVGVARRSTAYAKIVRGDSAVLETKRWRAAVSAASWGILVVVNMKAKMPFV